MVSIYNVDPSALIERVSEELKKSDMVQPPEWAQFVKTGPSKTRPPASDDWWYVRAASVLRAVYKEGPIGVAKLRTRYGSKQDRGLAPERFRPASGNILRTILQQLEKEGYLMQGKDKNAQGRHITPKGQSLLEKCASALYKTQDKSSKASEKQKSSDRDKAPKKESSKESPKDKPEKSKPATGEKEKKATKSPEDEQKKPSDEKSGEKETPDNPKKDE